MKCARSCVLQERIPVIENRLTRIALKNAGMPELADILEGPSAIVLERGDAMAAIKTELDFPRLMKTSRSRVGTSKGKC